MPHIAVLFHEASLQREMEGTVVFHMARFWREAGHRVTFLRGPKRFVPADLLFVHVNLSVVPGEYLELAARYPAAVNHRARDIRKSAVSENLIRPGTDWRGPVIVKTDLNFGGEPEFWLGSSRMMRWSRPGRLILRFSPRRRRITPLPSWNDYPIYDRLEDVPQALLNDPRIVIERFVPEIEGGTYHLRLYQFLGDRVTCRRIAAPDPLVKSTNTVGSVPIEPDPVVEGWRRRLGLDYGKIDYVIHDGAPVLLDANKTTGLVLTPSPEVEKRRRFLAEGIESFLPK